MSANPQSINLLEATIDQFAALMVASQLAWRHNLALAVAAGDIAEDVARELTGDVISDTASIMLGEVGPSLKKAGPMWNEMASTLSEQTIEIAERMEEKANAAR